MDSGDGTYIYHILDSGDGTLSSSFIYWWLYERETKSFCVKFYYGFFYGKANLDGSSYVKVVLFGKLGQLLIKGHAVFS